MIFDKPVATWTQEDLQFLVDRGIEESRLLEYKQELDLGLKKQNKEAAKDFSAFANGQGGIIIYGIQEEAQEDGAKKPVGLSPLTDGGLKEQLETVLVNSVTPRFDFAIHKIPQAEAKGFFLVAEIPQSLSGPHMVVVGKDNRYYKRRNFCAEPMTEEEVRIAYERNLSAAESLDRRYEQLRSKPDEDKYGFQVSILPRVDTDRFFDMRTFDPRRALPAEHPGKLTFAVRNLRRVRTCFRFDHSHYVFQLQPCGYIELTRVLGRRSEEANEPLIRQRLIPSRALVTGLWECLEVFARLHSAGAYNGQVRVYFRLFGAEGVGLGVPDPIFFSPRFDSNDWLTYADTSVFSMLRTTKPVVHELMDYFWQAFTLDKCFLLDENHELVRH